MIDYKDTRERDRLRNGIRRHNEVLAGTRIEPSPHAALTPVQRRLLEVRRRMYRVFNDGKFTRGGRFYGGAWQNLKKAERGRLQINGASVVELDYSGLHVRMLYHLVGREPSGDVYTFGGRGELRPIGKLITLIALNARTRTQAIGAIRSQMGGDQRLSELVETSGMRVPDLYDRFLERHDAIAKYFGTGVGVRLQNLDSEIMARVINEFTRAGIPLLPVHDSAIVPVAHEDALRASMERSYRKNFPGRTIEIRRA